MTNLEKSRTIKYKMKHTRRIQDRDKRQIISVQKRRKGSGPNSKIRNALTRYEREAKQSAMDI